MISWSNKHITILASLFIAIFVGALTINILCDLEIIDYAASISHKHEEPEKAATFDSHPQSNHDHGSNHDHITNDSHQSDNKADECCDDVAESLTSSLFYSLVKHVVPADSYFIAGIIEFKPQVIPQYLSENIIYHEYDDPPPLNGFELRVEIQSFLN